MNAILNPEAAAHPMRDQAYRALRRLLILQRIPEGERLREPYWAEKLAVNRSALREAFARLEAEGLIEKGGRTGYLVPVLSERDLCEVLRVRTILECGAIEEICELPARAAQCAKRLSAACKEFEQLLEMKYLLGTSEADRRFHEQLIDSAENRRLSMLYHRAPLPLLHSLVENEGRWLEQARLTLAEHQAIVKAIAAGDAAKAMQQLSSHLSIRSSLPLCG